MIKISPSVLACDLSRLFEEASAMEKAGADMIHLDVMDGHFVPNITFGSPVIKSLRKKTGIFFDTHLMISQPSKYIGEFVSAGADLVTFHAESEPDIKRLIDMITAGGAKAGVSLKPKTPPDIIREFLPSLSLVLVMTVEPGFGGQAFMADMLPKIARLRSWADAVNPRLDIEVDGGIDINTAPLAVNAGANVLVAGTALFGDPDYALAIERLRKSAEML